MSMQSWLVYDMESGNEFTRGMGTPEQAAATMQRMPEGVGLAIVPEAATLSLPTNLTIVKESYRAIVDMRANDVLKQFATDITGQDRRYLKKELEATQWTDGDEVEHPERYPFMLAEIAARTAVVGTPVSMADVRAEIMAQVAASTLPEAKIEAYRVAHKLKILTATNIGQIVEAATVDFQALLTP